MQNCPAVADMESTTESMKKEGWATQNAIDDPKVFEAISDPKLMTADVPLMYNIWLYFDVLCSEKSFS